jgi:hypothetical protein
MTLPMTKNDDILHGFYDIPDDARLKAMSFAELASELSSANKDSPKYMTLERELTRVHARDQARANRSNVVLGAVIAGSFALLGVFLGWFLRGPQPSETLTTPRTSYTNEKANHNTIARSPNLDANEPASPSPPASGATPSRPTKDAASARP